MIAFLLVIFFPFQSFLLFPTTKLLVFIIVVKEKRTESTKSSGLCSFFMQYHNKVGYSLPKLQPSARCKQLLNLLLSVMARHMRPI